MSATLPALDRLMAQLPRLDVIERTPPAKLNDAQYERELDALAALFPQIEAKASSEARNLTYGGERVARLRIVRRPADFVGHDASPIEVNAKVFADVIRAGLEALGKAVVL